MDQRTDTLAHELSRGITELLNATRDTTAAITDAEERQIRQYVLTQLRRELQLI